MDIKALLSTMTIKEKAYQLLQLNTLAFAGDKGEVNITGPVSKNEILGRVDFVISMKENKFFAMFKQMVKTIFAF